MPVYIDYEKKQTEHVVVFTCTNRNMPITQAAYVDNEEQAIELVMAINSGGCNFPASTFIHDGQEHTTSELIHSDACYYRAA